MSDEQSRTPAGAQAVGAPAVAPKAADGAVFVCVSCGHSQPLPAALAGRQAKCPKCGLPGPVARAGGAMPDERDVALDDLVPDDPSQARPLQSKTPTSPDSLALDDPSRSATSGQQCRHFLSGNLPVNLLAGLVGGAHMIFVCMALSCLAFTLGAARGFVPQSLALMLVPAVFGSLLLSMGGRLNVCVGAPDPSAVVAVFLLLAALCADLAGRASGPELAATLFAAMTVAGLLSGFLGVLFSRLNLAERVRFLPGEVLGGMLAGFGLLLVRSWGTAMAAGSPSLAALGAVPLAELGPAIAGCWAAWTPAVALGLLCFLVHMVARGIVWPLLLVAVFLGGWNALAAYGGLLPEPLASVCAALLGAQPVLPQMLDLRSLQPLMDMQTLAHVRWSALLLQAEFFAAVAAVAILPSILRTAILEAKLRRDTDSEEQMRLVGASSLFSGLLGALPASLSLSGSLGLRALGANGPLAGFTVGLVCLGFLFFGHVLLPFIPAFVPLGILLAIGLIMPVSWMLVDARNPLTRKDDLYAAWASCLLVVVLGPVLGVFGCLTLGVVSSLTRMVDSNGVRSIQTGDSYHSNVERSQSERRLLREKGGQILVLRLQGFLFLGTLYGVCRIIREQMAKASAPGLRFVLLDFGAVSGLGSSSAIGFQRFENLGRAHSMRFIFTRVPLEMEEHLEEMGYRLDDESQICRIALNLDYALEWCEDVILADAAAAATAESTDLPASMISPDRQNSLEELLAATFPDPRLVPALIRCLVRMEVARKTRIIEQGAPSDAIFFLQAGKVQAELTIPGGKVLRLKKMGPGTVFGEMGIYTSAPRSATVIAMEKCVVYKLSLERFQLIQSKAPQLAAAVNRYIVALLAERVAEANALNRAMQL